MGPAMRLPVAIALVHGDVVEVSLVGQQAQATDAPAARLVVGVPQQAATQAPALPCRRDCDVLDPELIRLLDQLKDADDLAVSVEDPDLVLADGDRVVGEHRHRRPADERRVAAVRGGYQVADRVRVGCGRPTQFWRGLGHASRGSSSSAAELMQ